MEEIKNQKIDYRKVFSEIKKRRKLYYYTLPLAILLSSLYIICIPRTYTSETEVAPESDGATSSSGTLGSLASTFGLDLSQMQSNDAITPMLYPDLMDDNGFITGLFKIKVKSKDGLLNTDYYTYLKKYQKDTWWNNAIFSIAGLFMSKEKNNGVAHFDPYNLSKDDYDIANNIRGSIKISVDKKTGAITISSTAQDPLICKTIADSVREHLQQFIIKYRTNKARKDLLYYRKLTMDAKYKYERQRQLYGSYADANTDIVLQSFRSKMEDMENEMQLRYNAYSTLNNQLQAAIAKVQERTPAFMLIKGASVPDKATSPKRMIFVFSIFLLAFIGTSIYILRDIILPHKK
jgi:capsule polysaccharide export protein KpsE/RkpR